MLNCISVRGFTDENVKFLKKHFSFFFFFSWRSNQERLQRTLVPWSIGPRIANPVVLE